MKKLSDTEIDDMTDKEIVDALVANAYDMGVAKVYLEAKNYDDDEHNINLLVNKLERRLNVR